METASNPRISPRTQRMFPEHFQYVREQRDAGAKEDEADKIQRIGLFAIVRQMQIDHHQTNQPDWEIHKKDQPPMKISDNQAAGDGAQHGTNQAGNRHETHGANEFRFGERPHDGQPSHRHHHGSAAALQDAAGHQHMDVGGYPAQQRSEGE